MWPVHHVLEMFLIWVKHRQETRCLSSPAWLVYTTTHTCTSTHTHTHTGWDRHPLLSSVRSSSQTRSAERTQLHVCDHTEDSPTGVYAWCKHRISTSCLWWWCTLQSFHNTVVTTMRPKKTSETHANSFACQNTHRVSLSVVGEKVRERGRRGGEKMTAMTGTTICW